MYCKKSIYTYQKKRNIIIMKNINIIHLLKKIVTIPLLRRNNQRILCNKLRQHEYIHIVFSQFLNSNFNQQFKWFQHQLCGDTTV